MTSTTYVNYDLWQLLPVINMTYHNNNLWRKTMTNDKIMTLNKLNFYSNIKTMYDKRLKNVWQMYDKMYDKR